MKRTILILLTFLTFSIGLVIVLYEISESPIDQRQGFIRRFHNDAVKRAHTLNIKYNSYYIAGATDKTFYLGNLEAPLHLLSANLTLTDTHHIRLHLQKKEATGLTRFTRVKIDSPYFYVTDGGTPALFHGVINQWRANRFMHDSVYFLYAIPINYSSFAVQAISLTPRENVLGKIEVSSPHLRMNHSILEKQLDGIFCTEGNLHYSNTLNKLVYVYTYRNQYIIIDTTLKVTAKGRTIDTFSHASIKPVEIISVNATHTLASPPAIVNRKTFVYKKYLFVNSGLLSKNESKREFDESSVIDVYDLDTQTYRFSFYLPDHNEEKIKSFWVTDHNILALYERHIISYNLSKAFIYLD